MLSRTDKHLILIQDSPKNLDVEMYREAIEFKNLKKLTQIFQILLHPTWYMFMSQLTTYSPTYSELKM
jgi:hypothetical protein